MNVLDGSWKPTPGENPVLVIVGGVIGVANGVLLFAASRGWWSLTGEEVAYLMGSANVAAAALAAVLARAKTVPAGHVIEVDAVAVAPSPPPTTKEA